MTKELTMTTCRTNFDSARRPQVGAAPSGSALVLWRFWRSQWRPLTVGVLLFAIFFFLPIGRPRFIAAVYESLALTRWYAREHFILCLVPAFFIAGAIAVFLSREAVLRYLGPQAPKPIAYAVASISGSLLAVCSCTILPLFVGIWKRGAGLGPAVAFLYAGPAINVLAIILTARVLGFELGVARAVGAIAFSVIIGLIMSFIYQHEERSRVEPATPESASPAATADHRPLRHTALSLAAMVAILVFANWGRPLDDDSVWGAIWRFKWEMTAAAGLAFGVILVRWFGVEWWKMLAAIIAVVLTWLGVSLLLDRPEIAAALGDDLPYRALAPFAVAVIALALITSGHDDEQGEWFNETWGFAKQIAPLLFIGVLIAGFLLGRPGEEGVIPNAWVASLLGGNSVFANLAASVLGAFMYFATLTEVPILQGLIGAGMGKGPALALLLAGPALSLPNMLVIRSVMGTGKTIVFVSLVVVMATLSGIVYAAIL